MHSFKQKSRRVTMIRTMKTEDISQVQKIEQIAWGDAAATVDQIKQRSSVFPEGSIVAEDDKVKIIGYASAQLVQSISTKSWEQQTDNGYITNTHDPDGQIAYGVGMSALPEGAHYGGGAHVIAHYHDIFIKSKRCSILCLGSRLPGFERWNKKHQGDIKMYLTQNSGSYSQDPELRLYQKNGFQLLWEIPNYFDDPSSLDYGAMIVRR